MKLIPPNRQPGDLWEWNDAGSLGDKLPTDPNVFTVLVLSNLEDTRRPESESDKFSEIMLIETGGRCTVSFCLDLKDEWTFLSRAK